MKRPPQIAISDSDWQRTPTAVQALVVRSLTVPWPATTPESYQRFVSARRFHLCYGQRSADARTAATAPISSTSGRPCGPSRTGRGGADTTNHGNTVSADGRLEKLVSGLGADIHLSRDDGTNLRDFPWGRDGNEFCHGHQCWQGRSDVAITSTSTREPDERQLISGRATAHVGDEGINTPGGGRNDLSRSFARPDFWHFATDMDGTRLITDAGPKDGGSGLAVRPSRGRGRCAREYAEGRKPRVVLAEGHPHPSFPLAGWRFGFLQFR